MLAAFAQISSPTDGWCGIANSNSKPDARRGDTVDAAVLLSPSVLNGYTVVHGYRAVRRSYVTYVLSTQPRQFMAPLCDKPQRLVISGKRKGKTNEVVLVVATKSP